MVHESLLYYQDKISSGILLFAAFVLLCLFSHSKTSMTVTNTTSRSRRGTVTAAAVIEPCALLVTEGGLVAVVGESDASDGIVNVAATGDPEVDSLVGTAE